MQITTGPVHRASWVAKPPTNSAKAVIHSVMCGGQHTQLIPALSLGPEEVKLYSVVCKVTVIL